MNQYVTHLKKTPNVLLTQLHVSFRHSWIKGFGQLIKTLPILLGQLSSVLASFLGSSPHMAVLVT